MDKLDEKQKEIIILSFGLYNQEPLTLIEIGERVNANRESVRQSKQKALKIMAKNMKKRGIKLEMLLN
jgi:RNA polymerase primary sigma factor